MHTECFSPFINVTKINESLIETNSNCFFLSYQNLLSEFLKHECILHVSLHLMMAENSEIQSDSTGTFTKCHA